MKATLITIGDEILIGQVIDTNSAWIAQQLNNIGIDVVEIISISDSRPAIIEALDKAKSNAEIAIVTGGLGPTKDDITKQVIAGYFNSKLVVHEASLKNISNLFWARGMELSELNRKQAEVPDSCTVLMNANGTAPGMLLKSGNTDFFFLPGVPYEMKALLIESVLPELVNNMLANSCIVHKTILTTGIGESTLAEKLDDWENQVPDFIRIAYLPKPGIVRVRLSARGGDKVLLNKAIEKEVESFKTIAGEYIFGFDDDSLEEIIGKILSEKKCTLATAESCSGGAIAKQITSIPGSSHYFKGSVIAYANDVKVNLLNVNNEDIAKYGAVSQQVVEQMAIGVRQLMNTDYSIATSGIAGPDGGTEEKPVGTIWIAVCSKEKVWSKKYLLGEHRGRNIEKTVVAALAFLQKMLYEL